MYAKNILDVYLVFENETIAASGSTTSAIIPLKDSRPAGYYSLEIEMDSTGGAGTLDFEYEVSNSGENFITPSNASNIATAFSKTDGPNSDGKDIFVIDTSMVVAYLKIKVTETSGSASATIKNAWLAIQ